MRSLTSDLCWICQRPVRFDVAPRTRFSPSVDHESELDRGLVDVCDTRYWRLAHFGCNSTRGNHYREARDLNAQQSHVNAQAIRTTRPI